MQTKATGKVLQNTLLLHPPLEDEYDENGPTGNTKYKLDTKEVTESEYRAEIDAYISYKDRVYWERGCSYTAMLNYLEGKGPKDYKEAYTQIINAHSSEAGTKFSLIEVTDRDPLLLIVDEKKMSLCSYEDGLVNEGPDNYFSDGQIILMYPSIGVIKQTIGILSSLNPDLFINS